MTDIAKAADAVDDLSKAVTDKSIYDQAQEAVTAAIDSATKSVTAAFETALEAAKENPKTAAAIAAGAAAAVAGAAFGVSKLLEDDKPAAKSSGTKTSSAKKN